MVHDQFSFHSEKRSNRNKETLEALEDIRAGRVVDGDKVLSWLADWGTRNEQCPPE